MLRKCANRWCSATRHDHEGMLFRLDIDLGSKAGGENERRTEYLWLCAGCADKMRPKVEVNGDTVTVRLSKSHPIQVADTSLASVRVN